ncbi:MBL fold metallo-hydrolase [Deinococcus cavernae]|uniref:MBL fold metallo-hydrolase n=1 Tax=Deinococcus cavernae TaxID=2320857 RepID=A0A418V593_9DEIO|nr:MBL fold metallo-hydrolase [Deinococcus cavernae]RJF71276.1 MBL fold metallo-hydrolase [Deinococcus cavernae]
MNTVQVIPLRAGECFNFAAVTGRGEPWRVKSFPAGFALIVHPQRGPVLFDTGYSSLVRRIMRRWPGVLYGLVTPVRLDERETARAQLARLGWSASDIREIIVSHLHADHVGALRDFPQARFLLDAPAFGELRGLQGVKAVRRAFLPELLPDDFAPRIQPLTFTAAPPGLSPFSEVADVFGDESVLAVRVPGHAPGMVALIARTHPQATWEGDGAGLTVLAADAAWTVRALREGLPVHLLGRLAFWNAAQEARSARQLRDWLTGHPQAQVIVSHDAPEVGRA